MDHVFRVKPDSLSYPVRGVIEMYGITDSDTKYAIYAYAEQVRLLETSEDYTKAIRAQEQLVLLMGRTYHAVSCFELCTDINIRLQEAWAWCRKDAAELKARLRRERDNERKRAKRAADKIAKAAAAEAARLQAEEDAADAKLLAGIKSFNVSEDRT